MISLLLRVWYSITARLVVLFLLVGGIGFILFLTLFRLYLDTQSRPLSYPLPFLSYLVEQLPPTSSQSQIEQLMNETIYSLRITSEQSQGPSTSRIPPFASLKKAVSLSPDAAYYTSNSGARYLVISRGGFHYTFGYRFKGQEDNGYTLVMLLIPLLAMLLLMLGYLIAGRFFIPINWIRKGAKRIGQGDLSYRIPYKRKDELGQLVDIVNKMAEDLERIFDSKRQLLLAISHELCSPLTRMKVNVALLDKTPMSTRLSDDIDEMRQIVEGLLDCERLQGAHTALDKAAVELAGFIGDIVKEYEQPENLLFCDETAAHGDKSGDAIHVSLDVAKIKFLVRNLINNALKYTEEGERQVKVQLNIASAQINLSVADNGCGIGEEHLSHIFSPFYRADQCRGRQTGGVGLGLYLCLLIAKAHGGNIFVQSTPGQGSCFSVTLPLGSGD